MEPLASEFLKLKLAEQVGEVFIWLTFIGLLFYGWFSVYWRSRYQSLSDDFAIYRAKENNEQWERFCDQMGLLREDVAYLHRRMGGQEALLHSLNEQFGLYREQQQEDNQAAADSWEKYFSQRPTSEEVGL